MATYTSRAAAEAAAAAGSLTMIDIISIHFADWTNNDTDLDASGDASYTIGDGTTTATVVSFGTANGNPDIGANGLRFTVSGSNKTCGVSLRMDNLTGYTANLVNVIEVVYTPVSGGQNTDVARFLITETLTTTGTPADPTFHHNCQKSGSNVNRHTAVRTGSSWLTTTIASGVAAPTVIRAAFIIGGGGNIVRDDTGTDGLPDSLSDLNVVATLSNTAEASAANGGAFNSGTTWYVNFKCITQGGSTATVDFHDFRFRQYPLP